MLTFPLHKKVELTNLPGLEGSNVTKAGPLVNGALLRAGSVMVMGYGAEEQLPMTIDPLVEKTA